VDRFTALLIGMENAPRACRSALISNDFRNVRTVFAGPAEVVESGNLYAA